MSRPAGLFLLLWLFFFFGVASACVPRRSLQKLMHPQTLERRLPPSQLQRQHRQHSIRALVDIHSCKSMTQSFAPPRFSSAYRMSDVAPEHYGRPQHPPMPLSSIVAGHARPPPTQVSAAVVLSRSPSPTSANFRPDKVLLRIYSPIPTRHHLPRHLPSLRHETRLPPGARLSFPKSWSLDLLVTLLALSPSRDLVGQTTQAIDHGANWREETFISTSHPPCQLLMTLRGTSTHPCTPWMDAQIPHRRRDALHASEKHRQPTPYPPTLLLVFSFIHRVLSYFCVSQGASGAVARKLLSSPLTAPHTVNSKKQFPDRHRSDAKTPGRQASHIWWPEAFLPAVLAKARRDDRAVVLLLPGVPRTMAALFAVRVDCKCGGGGMLIIMDVSAALPHHMSRIIEVLAKLATLSPFRHQESLESTSHSPGNHPDGSNTKPLVSHASSRHLRSKVSSRKAHSVGKMRFTTTTFTTVKPITSREALGITVATNIESIGTILRPLQKAT
ncbi:uncharacterized protein BKA78DRAFT_343484 [Phyllosticta capitalensis]|uniref:Secreted protein n=1 Tax=Phyllosticta capitalensis TaxID=121624 RepID=A0ABR1YP94_9PEZI